MKTQVYYRVQALEATPMTHHEFEDKYGSPLKDGDEDLGSGYVVSTESGDIWIPADDFEEITYPSGKDAITALKDLVKTTTAKDIQKKLDVALVLYDERNSLGRRIYTIANAVKLSGVPMYVFNEAIKARKGV